MLRTALLVMSGISLAACSEERHVRVVVETGESVTQEITSVVAHAQLTAADGVTALQSDETLPAGDHARPISFPADFVVLIGDASGAFVVTVTGRDAEDAPVASGLASAEVEAGGSAEVSTVHVVLERGGPGGGSCGDGIGTIGEICYGPALARTSAPGGEPAAADLDGDGILDLVTVVGGSDPGRGLSVSRGRGSDVFEAPRSVLGPSVADPADPDLALGDVNGDGLVDAVIASTDDEAPLLTLGRAEDPWFGLIAPIPDPAATAAGMAPELADLDADGDLDLVAVGDDAVWIATGAGDGTFSGNRVGEILGAWRAVPGELDGDAGLEIAIGATGTRARVLDADGATVADGDVGGSGNFHALLVADVDGTPPAELVAGVGQEVRVLHVEGGSLVLDTSLTMPPGRPLQLAAALDPDGAPAMMALVDEQEDANGYMPAVVWLTGGPGPALSPSARARVHCRNGRLAAADMDGDGQSEALLGCGDTGIAIEHRVDGELEVPQGGPGTAGFAVGDIDGDGRPDVVAHWWNLSLMRRADDPNAVDNIEEVPGSQGEEIDATFGDFIADERDDLVSACTEPDDWCADGTLKRWTANVGGAIETLPPLPLPALATSVTLARTIPDRKMRIVVTLDDGRLLSIDGETGDTEAEAQGASTEVWGSAAGALDEAPGDDVVVVGTDDRVVVFRGAGDGSLAGGVEIATAQDTTGLAVGDADADGIAEIVLTQDGTTNVQVLQLAGSGTEDDGSFAAGLRPRAVSLLDVDGDGVAELVLGGDDAIEMWSLRGAEGPTLRFVMAGLETYGGPLAIFSAPGDGDEWVPPLLFGVGRWDIAGNESWQEYVMMWRPRP